VQVSDKLLKPNSLAFSTFSPYWIIREYRFHIWEFQNTVEGYEISKLRASPPVFGMYLSGNIFLTFFRRRKIDQAPNRSGLVFF